MLKQQVIDMFVYIYTVLQHFAKDKIPLVWVQLFTLSQRFKNFFWNLIIPARSTFNEIVDIYHSEAI